MKNIRHLTVAAALLAVLPCVAQTDRKPHFNRDESAVPPYVEPDVLRMANGRLATTADEWIRECRPEVLHLLREDMFGFPPNRHLRLITKHRVEDRSAFSGLATRIQVTLVPSGDSHGLAIHLLLYLPNHSKHTVPVFLGLNYGGNQSVTVDPGVELHEVWLPDTANRLVLHSETATDAMRGAAASEWPIERMLQAGYGFATLYDGDLEPDFDGGEAYGFRVLPQLAEPDVPANQRWGAIGVWAWGLSRALDYLSKQPLVDAKRVIVIGHSRLGKAALWAGASDQRFGMVISNESGKGGAALMKRNFGETVEHLNTRFPYWFDGTFHEYSDQTDDMPFDSPFLLALVAPRPLYIASAAGDYTLDARGEYLAALLTTPVYQLYGETGMVSAEPPQLDQPIYNDIGYHIRPGKHEMLDVDWDHYLAFVSQHFSRNLK